MDDSEALDFLLGQLTSSVLEEVTGAMMANLITEARHLAVLFCKYMGYVVIAVTHTCYILRHYSPPQSQPHAGPESEEMPAMNGGQNIVPAEMAAAAAAGVEPVLVTGFLPPASVRGMARES